MTVNRCTLLRYLRRTTTSILEPYPNLTLASPGSGRPGRAQLNTVVQLEVNAPKSCGLPLTVLRTLDETIVVLPCWQRVQLLTSLLVR